MTTANISEKLKDLAKDLTKDFPRSPRETLGGYILAARILDKCRAVLNGTLGEYTFGNCPLDLLFFGFTGINAEDFKAFVATGVSDEEVGEWVKSHAKQTEHVDVVKWNNENRYRNIRELSDEAQLFLEDYIPQNIPAGRVIYHFFDVFDIEEKRL